MCLKNVPQIIQDQSEAENMREGLGEMEEELSFGEKMERLQQSSFREGRCGGLRRTTDKCEPTNAEAPPVAVGKQTETHCCHSL